MEITRLKGDEKMDKLITATRGRRYQFFDAPETDQLMSMLLASLSELSVTRERLLVFLSARHDGACLLLFCVCVQPGGIQLESRINRRPDT